MTKSYSPPTRLSDIKTTEDEKLAHDLLWGAEQIAAELGIGTRDVYYLLQQRKLPAVKCGSTWCTTKSRLRGFFNGEISIATAIDAPTEPTERGIAVTAPHAEAERDINGETARRHRTRKSKKIGSGLKA